MPNSARPSAQYDPIREAAERWSAWTFEETTLRDESEQFLPDDRIVLIDIDKFGGDRERAWAHVIVHLENGDHNCRSGWISQDREDFAEMVVKIRLDRAEDRNWLQQ